MKKLLTLIALIGFAQPAFADSCGTSLMPLFTSDQAAKICSTFGAGYIGTQANNTYVNARNAANSANISVWKVDSTDDTVLNADSGDVIKLAIAGTTEATLDDDKLTFSGASFKVVPGATSLLFRDNGDANTNLSITDAGVATVRAGLTVTVGNVTATNGEFVSSASGKTLSLQEATAGAACMGSLTCNGASDVVTSTTCATTGSRIFLTRTSLDADTTGDYYVKSISNGVSFTVACETSDTATLNWIIFHESP